LPRSSSYGSREMPSYTRSTHATAVRRRTWLRIDASARSVWWFRLLLGVALAAHFVNHALYSAPLLSVHGPLQRSLSDDPYHASVLLSGLSVLSLRCVFISVAFLCFGAVGFRWSRAVGVVLLIVAVSTYWAKFPVASVDDACACWCCLFLCLLPAPQQGGLRASPHTYSVSGFPVVCMLALALALDAFGVSIGSSGFQADSARLMVLTTRVLVLGLLAPSVGVRSLAAVAFAVLHFYLAWQTPLHLMHFALASASVLLWGHTSDSRPSPSHDFGAIVAPTALVLLALGAWGQAIGMFRAASSAQRVLLDLGLAPARPQPPGAAQAHGPDVLETTDARRYSATTPDGHF
jgi:hypothetical protein